MCNIKAIIQLYEGCGNRLLIVHLASRFSRKNKNLRQWLQRLGLTYACDSVLVLTGDPLEYETQGYHVTMDVFEPRGHDSINPSLAGSWSTMCGNGIRAVARYLLDTANISCMIKTGSGMRETTILPDHQFKVCMGEFTMRERHLKKYVHRFDVSRIIDKNVFYKDIFIGFNGSPTRNGNVDGEPHLVIILSDKKGMTLEKLAVFTKKIGLSITTNRKYFPECINTNFVVIQKREQKTIFVLACTFERGVEYVTKACGTGATAIGSYLLQQNPHVDTIVVTMLGGTLSITRGESNEFYLTGPANPIDMCKVDIDVSV